MKKILFLFVISFFLFCPTLVEAASVKIEGPTEVGMVGDDITVTVTLEEQSGLGSWEYWLNYDSSKLKLLSGEPHVVGYVESEGQTTASYSYVFEVLRAGSAVVSIVDTEVASWDEVVTNPTCSTNIILKGNYWVEENGNWYYYKDEERQQGFQEIDGKTYFFSYVTSALKYGLQVLNGKTFYLNNEGIVQYGWHEIDGFKYYFGSDGFAYQGFQPIDGVTYFFSNVNNALKTGWQGLDGKLFYLNNEGIVQYGWHEIDGFKYYFGSDGFAYQGFQPIDGKTYFFSYVNSALKTGWQVLDNNLFYLTSEGIFFEGDGFQTIEGKRYYFVNNYAVRGEKEIEGKTYYFDSLTGELRTGLNYINGNEYYYDEYGFLTKIQYVPVYYNQKDERWGYILYGLGLFKSTGCAPTSMAMAFSSILEKEILPTDVANYLYYNTNEFNRKNKGSSGMAIIYASKYYNVKCTPLNSKEEIIAALSEGKLVYAAMGPGKFATVFYNHAIILAGYDNGLTMAYDPLKPENNSWTSVDQIFNEQSKDPDDSLGGSNFYVLEKN